jgi:hypothetical protein
MILIAEKITTDSFVDTARSSYFASPVLRYSRLASPPTKTAQNAVIAAGTWK